MAKRPIFLQPYGEAIAIARAFQPYHRKAVQSPNGDFWVGYGHRFAVGPGAEVTREKAEELLQLDLDRARELILAVVTVELEQWQYDAILDFAVTLEPRQFLYAQLPTLINRGRHDAVIATMLPHPDYAGNVSEVLTARREAEAYLYKNRKLPPTIK